MATGWPMKTTYADGDVYAAQDVNDITGTINLLGSSVAYAAGKNKIINGDFFVNQRAFTTTTSNGNYTFDRFGTNAIDGTSTYTAQTFTLGSEPVAGANARNYITLQSSGQTLTSALTSLGQKVENVGTFAGQTVTMSFYAKASSGTPNITGFAAQNFGSGGSSTVNTGSTKKAITTSWARYSFTMNIPSITGKTVNANNHVRFDVAISAGTDRNAYTDSLGIQSVTIDVWGIQVEAGSTATAFQTATGTIQGELAACQRYYYRVVNPATSGSNIGISTYGSAATTGFVGVTIPNPVTLRTAPASVDFSSSLVVSPDELNSSIAVTGVALSSFSNSNNLSVLLTVSGATQYRPYRLYGSGATTYMGFSAEL
jgi:hypothetical protein